MCRSSKKVTVLENNDNDDNNVDNKRFTNRNAGEKLWQKLENPAGVLILS